MATIKPRYWKITAIVPSGKRNMYLRGDWRIFLSRQFLVGKVVDNTGDPIEKEIPGGLSEEIVWAEHCDILKCIEMQMSNKYARLVAKRGEIVNCD